MYSLPEQVKYEQILKECEEIIGDIEQIVIDYEDALQDDDDKLSRIVSDLNDRPFERMRSKLKSGLINIVVCGAFSTGKSFLISGLINRLTWYRKPQSDVEDFENLDGYSSFLPSSPEQTSSCPLAIVPNESPGQRSRLEILFDDTKVWEDVTGIHSNEEIVAGKLLAYVTNVQDWYNTRAPKDLSRYVLDARLYISEISLPAIIHDLPGIGGAGQQYGGFGEYYSKRVHDSLRQADCIVYISSAIRELTEAELELLSVVEEVSEKVRCPVFFVLSQIDRESRWKKVLEKNNQFLREYFKRDGKANTGFIGQGFIPVSPAVEAKAHGLHQTKEVSEEEYNQRLKASRMPLVRQMINEHLTKVSGPIHLREIILQAHGLLKDIRVSISDRIKIKSIPIQEARSRMREYQNLAEILIEKKTKLVADLEELGKQTMDAAFAGTDSDDLLKLLREGLEPIINKEDVLKESIIHTIERHKKDIQTSWLRRPDKGFEVSWSQAWSDYQNQSAILLNRLINEAIREAAIPVNDIVGFIRDKQFSGLDGEEIKLKETLELVNTAWNTWLGITASIGGLASITGSTTAIGFLGSLATALTPVGLVLVTLGTLSLGWSVIRQHRERNKIRKEIINQIPNYADQVVQQLEAQARQFIAAYRGEAIKIVNKFIMAQQEACAELEKSLEEGEHKFIEDQISSLRKLEEQCEKAEDRIEGFYSTTASIVTLNA